MQLKKSFENDFTVFRDIFQQDLDDLPENWDLDHMFVPMWDMQDPCEGTYAIEMLEKMAWIMHEGAEIAEVDLPEVVCDKLGHDAANKAWEVMVKKLSSHQLRLFPQPWQDCLRWLKRHQLCNLTSYDLESQGMEIHNPVDILHYFSAFKEYGVMQQVTVPLFNAFEKESDAEWIALFEAFVPKARIRKPKSKTLVEVLA